MKFSRNSDNFASELKRIKSLSTLVEEKLSKSKKDKKIVDDLSVEDLNDLNKILLLTDFILCKNEDKKEFYIILKEFVEMIKNSADSLTELDDEINEMVLSAENSLSKMKEIQSKVSESYSFNPKETKASSTTKESGLGSNNFTKSSTPVYTQGYQPNSTVEAGQVI